MLLLYGRIEHILHKTAVRHAATAADGVASLLPWTDVITACVDYQLIWLRYHKVGRLIYSATVFCAKDLQTSYSQG